MVERNPWDLPDALVRHLADSELAVVTWDGTGGTLSLQVTKDIGLEIGRLVFRGVSQVNLLQRVEISGIEVAGFDDLPAGFIASCRPGNQQLDPEERVYLIHGSWGDEFFIIAEAVDYEVRRS